MKETKGDIKKKSKAGISNKERMLLDFIGEFESNGGDYNILYSGYKGKAAKPLTEMTVSEVLALQNKMKGSGSSAVGAHQIINDTLLEEIKKQKISKDEVFSPELQDKIIVNRLKRFRGFDKFLNGTSTAKEFAKKLSQEFASIPNPETGRSYYDGDGLNKSLTNVDTLLNRLKEIKNYKYKPGKTKPPVVEETVAKERMGSDLTPYPVQKRDNTNVGIQPTNNLLNLNSLQLPPQTNEGLEVPKEKPVKVPMVNSNAEFIENYLNTNQFKYGGSMKNLYQDGGLLTEFNTGGPHETNPMGGVQVGTGANGQPNLVEEGETQSEDYIFSDRMIIDKATAEKFYLPKGTIGKSPADASKIINAPADENNSLIDKETAVENLDRLKQVNEYLKEMQMPQQQPNPNMFSEGGFAKFKESGGMEGAAGLAGMVGGAVGGDTGNIIGGVAEGAQMGAGLGLPGIIGGAIIGGGLSIFSNEAAQKEKLRQTNNAATTSANTVNSMFALGGSIDPDYPANPQDLISSFQTNKEALNYANPYPQRSDRWNMLNDYQNKLKNSSFGEATNMPLNIRTYKDVSAFKGPLLKDEITNRAKIKERGTGYESSNRQYLKNTGGAITNKFDKGGQKTRLQTRGVNPLRGNNSVMNAINSGEIKDVGINFEQQNQQRLFDLQEGGVPYSDSFVKNTYNPPGSNTVPSARKQQSLNEAKKYSSRPTTKGKKGDSKFGEKLGQSLRYAPALMNAIQLASMKRPVAESRDRINTRFKPDYVDEAQLTNMVNEQYGGLNEAIANSSNSSLGALRTNMMASNLGRAKAMSNAFMQADNANRQQNLSGQQFNLGNEQFNIGQSNLEKDVNARNVAAYDNNRSRMLGALGNDLGGIGLEQLRKKYPELMGLDYDTFGRFLQQMKNNTVT